MELSKLIKMRREAKGYSIRRLAEEARISHTEIKRIEDGTRKQPSPKNIQAIADVLGITHRDIMVSAGYLDATIPKSGDRLSASSTDSAEQLGLDDLSDEEINEVKHYIAFLKSKRDGDAI